MTVPVIVQAGELIYSAALVPTDEQSLGQEPFALLALNQQYRRYA